MTECEMWEGIPRGWAFNVRTYLPRLRMARENLPAVKEHNIENSPSAAEHDTWELTSCDPWELTCYGWAWHVRTYQLWRSMTRENLPTVAEHNTWELTRYGWPWHIRTYHLWKNMTLRTYKLWLSMTRQTFPLWLSMTIENQPASVRECDTWKPISCGWARLVITYPLLLSMTRENLPAVAEQTRKNLPAVASLIRENLPAVTENYTWEHTSSAEHVTREPSRWGKAWYVRSYSLQLSMTRVRCTWLGDYLPCHASETLWFVHASCF